MSKSERKRNRKRWNDHKREMLRSGMVLKNGSFTEHRIDIAENKSDSYFMPDVVRGTLVGDLTAV